MNKRKLLAQVISDMEQKATVLMQSAKAAYEGATHEENKSEDKYDTRGLEASYLAMGQSERLNDLFDMIKKCRALSVKEFTEDTPIATTALMELESNGKSFFYFLGPFGGGTEIEFEGALVILITPASPIGEKLTGLHEGDCVEVGDGQRKKEYEILSVE